MKEIKPFTYIDYLYYKEIFQQIKHHASLMLREKEEKYNYQKVNNPHDKIFKDVLDDKKEVVTFINRMLNLEKTKNALKEEELEKYNREFITENFQSIASDVIYKKKDQKVFFLIEQQSTIDNAMAYRILKYNMAIMDSAIEKEKLRQKDYKLPIIFSFVIYTGNEKWNVTHYLTEKQEKLAGCEPRAFANFQLMDVNDYTNQELLHREGFLAKAMLLEKARNYEELETYLELIMKEEMEDRQKELLQRMIKYVYKNKLNHKKYDKFIKELQLKQEKGGDSMFAEILSKKIDEVFEMEEKVKEQETKVKEREKKIEKKEVEIKKEKIKIIINMIKNNIDENTILKITNIDKKGLAEIKKEINA